MHHNNMSSNNMCSKNTVNNQQGRKKFLNTGNKNWNKTTRAENKRKTAQAADESGNWMKINIVMIIKPTKLDWLDYKNRKDKT